MNQFEAARQKHAKNLERRMRTDAVATHGAKVTIAEPEPEKVVFIEAPKERPMTDAFIEVRVSLPSGDIAFTLVKQDIEQNATMSRLTRLAFVNGVMKGLEPLLGVVKEK